MTVWPLEKVNQVFRVKKKKKKKKKGSEILLHTVSVVCVCVCVCVIFHMNHTFELTDHLSLWHLLSCTAATDHTETKLT